MSFPPANMKRALAARASGAQAGQRVQAKLRGVLARKARPIECRAVVRYVLAARTARAASVEGAHARRAAEKAVAYGDERIAECIEAERKRDPSLRPYRPGELERALAGRVREPRPESEPPPVAEP